jgi:nucleotide-binding universal stress UspA family protein
MRSLLVYGAALDAGQCRMPVRPHTFFMYRRILVAVDGTAPSDAAFRAAIGLARLTNAAVRLVHVIGQAETLYTEAHGFDIAAVTRTQRTQAEDLLAGLARTACEAGVTVETAVLETPRQPVWETIDRECDAWQADLVVLGTHGRHGVRRMVLGSDAECVIRTSPVPVLAVKAPAR